MPQPCELDTETGAAATQEATPDVPVGRSDDRSRRILLVDDQLVERRRIGGLLSSQADTVLFCAANGRDALAIVEREKLDVVLTDLQMPDIDGLDLVRTLRGRRPELPVVLITSYGSEEIAIQALRAGAANYVPKRHIADDLAEILRQVLELSAGERKRQDLMGCLEERHSRFRLGNDQRLFAPLVDLLQADLAASGFTDPAGRMQFGIALHEALANALYHGNLELSSELRQFDDERPFYREAEHRRGVLPYRDRKITVDSRVNRAAAHFTITDDGPGFDTSIASRPLEPDDLNRIGGKGLLLIKAFVDAMQFNDRGNQIVLELNLKKSSEAGADADR